MELGGHDLLGQRQRGPNRRNQGLGRWLCKLDHGRRQHLRDAAHTCADDKQAAACRFQNRNAKRLRQRAVEENVAAHQHVSNMRVGHATQHLDAILELMLLPHLLQEQLLIPVSAYDEMDARVPRTNDRDDLGDQVDALAVYEPTDNHHVDTVVFFVTTPALPGVWRELVRIHGVGDSGKQDGMKASPQCEVLPTGVGNAYAVIKIGEDEAHDLVDMDAGRVRKAKQGVVCVHQLVTVLMGMNV